PLPPHPGGAELAAECATGRWAPRGPGTPSSAQGTRDGRGSASDRRPEADGMRVVFLVAALLLSFPAVVGSAAGATAAAPQTAPAKELFAWVPRGGFPDRFPFGQCTWWAAYT